jgi:uncharacterized membrane protein YgcG
LLRHSDYKPVKIFNYDGEIMGKFDIDKIDIQQNVSDFAKIIEPGFEQKIHDVIVDIEARTTAEVAVITLDSLEGMSIDNAANKLFNKFGIGKKIINNGVLLLISCKDGEFRFELGYGLEDMIDEKMRKALIEKIMGPEFKKEHFGPAILKFLKKVRARISRSRMSNLSLVSWLTGILSLVFAAAGIFSSLVIALTSFPEIERPGPLLLLFVKTCIPAMLLGLASIVLAIIDFSLDFGIPREERIISKSISGIIMGVLAITAIFAAFYFFPQLADIFAAAFSLPTSAY